MFSSLLVFKIIQFVCQKPTQHGKAIFLQLKKKYIGFLLFSKGDQCVFHKCPYELIDFLLEKKNLILSFRCFGGTFMNVVNVIHT